MIIDNVDKRTCSASHLKHDQNYLLKMWIQRRIYISNQQFNKGIKVKARSMTFQSIWHQQCITLFWHLTFDGCHLSWLQLLMSDGPRPHGIFNGSDINEYEIRSSYCRQPFSSLLCTNGQRLRYCHLDASYLCCQLRPFANFIPILRFKFLILSTSWYTQQKHNHQTHQSRQHISSRYTKHHFTKHKSPGHQAERLSPYWSITVKQAKYRIFIYSQSFEYLSTCIMLLLLQ